MIRYVPYARIILEIILYTILKNNARIIEYQLICYNIKLITSLKFTKLMKLSIAHIFPYKSAVADHANIHSAI